MPSSQSPGRVIGRRRPRRPGRGTSPSGAIRVRCAPSVASRRLASSTTRSRTSSGSRRAAIRAVMSRSDRSVSARRARARLERSSSSMSRALVIAMAACSARPPRTAASSSSNACGSRLMTSMAPSGPASPMIGAAMRSRTPASSTSESARSSCWNSPCQVVADVDDPALGDGLARDALAEAQAGHLDAPRAARLGHARRRRPTGACRCRGRTGR